MEVVELKTRKIGCETGTAKVSTGGNGANRGGKPPFQFALLDGSSFSHSAGRTEWGGKPISEILAKLDSDTRTYAESLLKRDPLGPYGCAGEGIIFTNNAATAPLINTAALASPLANAFYNSYGGRNSVASRGSADPRTALYTDIVNHYRTKIEEFVGLDPQEHALLFGTNTSDVIGKTVLACNFTKQDVVLVPQAEHTSNSLPWERKSGATVVTINSLPDGAIDIEDLKQKLGQYAGRVRLVAFTAASNILPVRPNVKEIVRLAHDHGALAFVDCAQYAPHFPMDQKGWGADFVAFTGHKLGAGSGLGVISVPRWWLDGHEPVIPGGGTIKDLERVEGSRWIVDWHPYEAKHQAGTWDTIGIVALGAVAEAFSEKWDWIIEREHELLKYAYEKFSEIPGFVSLPIAPKRFDNEFLTPVITFNLEGYSPSELSGRLAEKGIQTRGGDDEPICNHEYVRGVLGLRGIVRLSFSFHNTEEEIDGIADALWELRSERPVAQSEVHV